MHLYAGTIFVSAFLLFLVQPIIAKQILPWFVGSASVWATCLVFFQTVLLFGYAYADWSTRALKPRAQAALHVALGGLPDSMQVKADKDIGVSAKTVGELRRVTAWSENLVITTPQERYPESGIKVSKASVATRVTPKP